MSGRKMLLGLVVLVVLAVVPLVLLGEARAEPTEAQARAAWDAAVKRGQKLWNGSWGEGTKNCAGCHGPGPNRMRSGRMKSYPKFDKVAGKVITGQMKLNQMITTQSLGKALPLGSDDLTALEAYLSTMR